MFMSGFVLILGLAFLFVKLPRRTALKLLGRPLLMDICVVVLMTVVHWGTFTGLMAAAFAGLMCSFATSGARYLFGYIEGKKFYPGKIYVEVT